MNILQRGENRWVGGGILGLVVYGSIASRNPIHVGIQAKVYVAEAL